MDTATTLKLGLALTMVMLLPAGSRPAFADDADTCAGGVLQAGSGGDLVITAPCAVKAGNYQFRDVHVLAGGTLSFEDARIEFWAANILVEKDGSLIAGSPSEPIGTHGGQLAIHLWGADQTGNDRNRQGRGVPCLSDDKGQCGVPDDIWNANRDAMGMPVPVSQARPISALASAASYPRYGDEAAIGNDYFYAYTPLPLDGADNPTHGKGYFGYKVLGVSYGGTLQLFGRKGASYTSPECGAAPSSSGSSWARLDGSTAIGATQIKLDRPLRLQAGDHIVVTSTDYVPGHSEEAVVASDVECSTQVALRAPLKHAHNGIRFALSTVPQGVGLDATLHANGAEVRAAVGVLTRSIRIVSGGDTLDADFPPEPTLGSSGPGYSFGGHVVVRQGFKRFQMQGVELRQLGQGGRMGHYPLHFHLTRWAPSDTFLRDSSVNESMTRWIVLHGAQNLRLERNVGWKSIGHGFYLEDGTETDNKFIANLGVFARAAVDNVQNPRRIPGILAAPNLHLSIGENVPFRSDYDHPTVFWIMNGWNDFEDNMAVGAGTCGVCYWWLTSMNSGMSRNMKWSSYASMQAPRNGDPHDLNRAGMVPLKSFTGNTCAAAMTSFQTVTGTEACQGIGPGDAAEPHPLNLEPVKNPLAGNQGDTGYYPTLDPGGGHFPTQCTSQDCSTQPARCSAGSPADCMVTVLDRYTTSFNWAAFNFAAIWLRPQWYLVSNSVITDVQQAGLTMVTGGGYSESDVIPGHWALVHKSVFIGHTQDGNPYASSGSAFNPNGLHCAIDANGNRPPNFCLSIDEGISVQTSNFGMYQRLFSVYDGPAYQDSNAYLNIKTIDIDDCKPFVDRANKVGRCDPDMSNRRARQSEWLAGSLLGLPKVGSGASARCYMPNAAIGWKQPNGFYYPPAFHSRNLYFDKVDIRHFVVTPLVKEGSLITDFDAVEQQYCSYNSTLFAGFAGNDRQTVLNDDDGTLTGYVDTTVINKDDFFAAPIDATQCLSANSSRTSPYQYVTTVLYPACAINGTCALAPQGSNMNWNSGDWNRACTNEDCYGVPLWRQNEMPIADHGLARSIRMMGQETGQRSSLTANHGTYYIDTAVSKKRQLSEDGCLRRNDPTPCVVNVFKPGESYYLFLVFAKPDTEQTYRFYVGENTDFDPASIQMVKARIGVNPIVFDESLGALPSGRARWLNGDKATARGVVEVSLRMDDLPGAVGLFDQGRKDKCQPRTFCTLDARSQCVGVDRANDAVCAWAGADQDCPAGGCFGIKFTLPAGFQTLEAGATDPRPPAQCVQNAAPWDYPLQQLGQPYPGDVCPQRADDLPHDFCAR